VAELTMYPDTKRRVVYLSGPYRAPSMKGVLANIIRANAYAQELTRLGYAVLCPHMNTAGWENTAPDISVEAIMDMDTALLEACEIVYMMPYSDFSAGAVYEALLAEESGKLFLKREDLEARLEAWLPDPEVFEDALCGNPIKRPVGPAPDAIIRIP